MMEVGQESALKRWAGADGEGPESHSHSFLLLNVRDEKLVTILSS